VHEIPEATGPTRAALEGERLVALRRPGPLLVLDERGPAMASAAFAARLQGWLDAGEAHVNFAIGGADGHAEALRAGNELMSFGPMTLPHLLVRVVLLEQLYRAVTIRLDHPYHRA
jgi:23S rRNA (pseudouridine1915-N3)-methyltransferase